MSSNKRSLETSEEKSKRPKYNEVEMLRDEVVVVAVGMRYHAGPTFRFGKKFELSIETEPTNQYDPHAVKVCIRNQENRHVAYIGKRHSKQVADILNRGRVYSVRFVKETSTELAATLAIECDSPALRLLKEKMTRGRVPEKEAVRVPEKEAAREEVRVPAKEAAREEVRVPAPGPENVE